MDQCRERISPAALAEDLAAFLHAHMADESLACSSCDSDADEPDVPSSEDSEMSCALVLLNLCSVFAPPCSLTLARSSDEVTYGTSSGSIASICHSLRKAFSPVVRLSVHGDLLMSRRSATTHWGRCERGEFLSCTCRLRRQLFSAAL